MLIDSEELDLGVARQRLEAESSASCSDIAEKQKPRVAAGGIEK